MKIGLVLASAPGYSETFFNSKIEGLKASGYCITLFCATAPKTFDLCEVCFLPKRYKTNFFQLLMTFWVFLGLLPYLRIVIRFYSFERQQNISRINILKLIYFNAPIFKRKLDWLHFGFGTLAIGREFIAKSIGAKLAVSFRGFDLGVYPIKHPNCYMKLWECVDKIHVISNDLYNLVYLNGFKGQVPIVKITPAIDIKLFSSSQIPTKLHEPIRFLSVARLHWKKGLDYTLKALALLKQEGRDFQYTIIGVGKEYEYLVFLSYQLGLKDDVKFIGKQSPNQIREHMHNADVYLQYSVQEGFCNSVLEAQAMGLLCIVSDAEGLSENVLDGETGWVVPKRQPSTLTKYILSVLNLTETEIISRSKGAVQRVKTLFNLKKQQESFLRFYKE